MLEYGNTPGGGDKADTQTARLPFWVSVFVVGLIIPLFIFIGPLRLSVYRIILLLMFLPMLYLLFRGKAGRIRIPDICVIFICIWSSISFSILHGLVPMIDTIGILWIETLGAYLVGRCFIRTPDDFLASVRFLFRIGLLMTPFVLYELYSGNSLLLDAFGLFGPTYAEHKMESRLGLERVQGPFAHTIHFGVFFGALVGVAYYVIGYGRSQLKRIQYSIFCVFLCFSSLSSGPLAAAVAQISFLTWDGMLRSIKSRWKILAGLSVLAYIIIDIISNRTPFEVFISYFALNPSTAYHRIQNWVYGTQNIWSNPIFGIGFNDWARPHWMVSSVDMFWILPAMRHGIPVWVLWFILFFSIFLSIINRKNLNERVKWYKTGYLCSMSGFFIAGWTVHYWDGLYVFFLFMLASGMWILDWHEEQNGNQQVRKEVDEKYVPYSRFPARSG